MIPRNSPWKAACPFTIGSPASDSDSPALPWGPGQGDRAHHRGGRREPEVGIIPPNAGCWPGPGVLEPTRSPPTVTPDDGSRRSESPRPALDSDSEVQVQAPSRQAAADWTRRPVDLPCNCQWQWPFKLGVSCDRQSKTPRKTAGGARDQARECLSVFTRLPTAQQWHSFVRLSVLSHGRDHVL